MTIMRNENELMETLEAPPAIRPMRLRAAWGYYLGSVLIQAVVLYLCFYRELLSLGVFSAVWLLQGAWLNRKVLRQLVEWHPVYSTVGNVIGAKVRFWLLWPIQYAILLVQLTLDELI